MPRGIIYEASISSPAGRKKALKEFLLDRMLRETERVYGEVLKFARNPCHGGIPVLRSLRGQYE